MNPEAVDQSVILTTSLIYRLVIVILCSPVRFHARYISGLLGRRCPILRGHTMLSIIIRVNKKW